jgi:hypothetical protein
MCVVFVQMSLSIRSKLMTIKLNLTALGSVLVVCMTLGTMPAWADNRQATLKTVQGDVSVLRPSQRESASPGMALHTGDTVVTGAHSTASMTFQDGTVIALGESAHLDITQYAYNSTLQQGSMSLGLLQGALRMITGIMGKTNPELMHITTPTAVIGVRGTDFIVEATP